MAEAGKSLDTNPSAVNNHEPSASAGATEQQQQQTTSNTARKSTDRKPSASTQRKSLNASAPSFRPPATAPSTGQARGRASPRAPSGTSHTPSRPALRKPRLICQCSSHTSPQLIQSRLQPRPSPSRRLRHPIISRIRPASPSTPPRRTSSAEGIHSPRGQAGMSCCPVGSSWYSHDARSHLPPRNLCVLTS